MVSGVFGTLMKSFRLLLARYSHLSRVIHSAEQEEIVGFAAQF